jgi:arachidonate 15-lipoxygenase
MQWSPFARPASLPTDANRQARQRDLAAARLRYDYEPAQAADHIVITKAPLPRAELPGMLWNFLAARMVLRVKKSINGGNVTRKMTTSSSSGRRRFGADMLALMRRVTYAAEDALATLRIFVLSSVLIAIPSEVLGRRIRDAISASVFKKMDKRVAQVIASLEDDAKNQIPESPEFGATDDYKELVDLENMSYVERSYYENFASDAVFARARVAGLNPMTLRAVTVADMDTSKTGWMPTDMHLRQASSAFARDSLLEAQAQHRLYILDYKWLEDAPDSACDARCVFVPKALFAVPVDDSARWEAPLVPVAIWIHRKGMKQSDAKLYTPKDGYSWQIAKLIVNVLDGNDHEYYRHLGLTHLLIEPFAIALKRHLHGDHPLVRLLDSHIVGTMFINREAVQVLLAGNGPVDMNLMSPITQMAPVLNDKLSSIRFNDHFLEPMLEARGVANSELSFPYRDYSRLLWTAIRSWIQTYIFEFYEDDSSVVLDTELQQWAHEIVSSDVINIDAFGDDAFLSGRSKHVISTRSYLIEALTMIVFTASCQHAALNFAQKYFLAYSPAWPLALKRTELPPAGDDATKTTCAEWKSWLPTLKEALVQWSTNQLLGGVTHTRLGQYPPKVTAGKPRLQQGLADFQSSLADIGAIIEKREESACVQYLVLHPDQIPASINI